MGAVRDHNLIQFQNWKSVNSVYRKNETVNARVHGVDFFVVFDIFLSMINFLEFCPMSSLHRIDFEPRFSKLVLLFAICGFKKQKTELQRGTESMGHSVYE